MHWTGMSCSSPYNYRRSREASADLSSKQQIGMHSFRHRRTSDTTGTTSAAASCRAWRAARSARRRHPPRRRRCGADPPEAARACGAPLGRGSGCATAASGPCPCRPCRGLCLCRDRTLPPPCHGRGPCPCLCPGRCGPCPCPGVADRGGRRAAHGRGPAAADQVTCAHSPVRRFVHDEAPHRPLDMPSLSSGCYEAYYSFLLRTTRPCWVRCAVLRGSQEHGSYTPVRSRRAAVPAAVLSVPLPPLLA